MAEAFTMKRTIATKMIVMSNEFRTRGSMPGAIRSEIIVRSSAPAAIGTPSCTGWTTSKTVGSQARIAQERGQEGGPDGQRRQQHVLVRGVRAGALGAEAVQHRNAERADEVAVGAAAGGGLVEVETEP